MRMPPVRGLTAHLVSSATGAANDNLFRQLIAVALMTVAVRELGSGTAADRRGELYVQLAGLAFLVPFVLLAPLAGALGDRLPRHLIVRGVRIAEPFLCAVGVAGFAFGSVPLMLLALMGLAVQSALFAPVKLALLPDLAPGPRFAPANGALQAVTVAAILVGTALAAAGGERIAAWTGLPPWATVLAIAIALSAVGIVAGFRIPALPAAAPATPLRPFALLDPLRTLRAIPGAMAPAIGLALFWGLGAAAQILVIAAAEQTWHLGQDGNVVFALALAVGIIVGSLLAPLLNARAYPAGLPLVGTVLAGGSLVVAGLIAHAGGDRVSFALWLVAAGVGAGLWEVPLQILLLERVPPERRNQAISGAGVLGSLAMVAAIGASLALTQLADTRAPQALAILGGVALAIAAGFLWNYRRQVAAWAVCALVRTAYRVRVHGAERLPRSGGCVIACNHLSYADGLILAASLPRQARFMVYRRFCEMPVVGWVLRAAGVIPVAAEDRRDALMRSLDSAVAAAAAGEVVVIFPEGKLTRSGQLDRFRGGMERIARRAGVPVLPAHLHGLWGTVASRAQRTAWPRLLRRVELHLGEIQPSETTAAIARDHVMHLSYEQAQSRSDRDGRTLGTALLRQAKRHPRHVAVQDAGGTITVLQLAAIARGIAPLLGLADDERRVGVLLPPGRGGAIVNAALALLGRTAVNLNHTAGTAQVERMCELAGVRTVITAGAYTKRIGEPPARLRQVKVEDLLPRLPKWRIVLEMAKVILLPTRLLARAKPDAVAAIIFSSGSTGDPKGVELTHRQILANCDAVAAGLELHAGQDVILSPLPLFHSFGLVPGMWLGLVLGMRVASQPDPTDAKSLGALAEASGATLLIGTPTFARGYLRRIEPKQFATLRLAVAGAERCPADLRQQFKERFGADLLEGYGCTELAPVVAVNLPLLERDGVREIRSRDGSVGRPLPGIHVLAIDPETRQPLPPGGEGLLVVRSAARMRGYLDRPDLTGKAFIHGGYDTGDIGHVDEDGFVFITGRLARFAKIGGEMVPLDNVEAALATGAGDEVEVAVAAVPDAARGERLLVLHTGFTGDVETWLRLEQLPALWRPKAKDVHRVETIPRLGTGKRDLGALKRMAAERAGAEKQAVAG